MPFPKKFIPFASVLTVAFIFLLFKPLFNNNRWASSEIRLTQWSDDMRAFNTKVKTVQEIQKPISFHPGVVKPYPAKYSKMLVIASTQDEDVNWIEENFENYPDVQSTIYTADDLTATNHPPKNKGHEVMIYLTYIIDHYNNLSDVNIFMHSHQLAWHNNELLDLDSAQMISRLSPERVIREGYMNLRCHWHPGCPDWMHPGTVEEDDNKQEQTIMARAWSELFPLEPIPYVLAQPCCAQFAVSRERIQALPLARYIFYRDWLLKTDLSDFISGRVWEYIWQFVFSGQTTLCPKEHVCYCDGYGICFGGEMEYQVYLDKQTEKEGLNIQIDDWNARNEEVQNLIDERKEEKGEGEEGEEEAKEGEEEGEEGGEAGGNRREGNEEVEGLKKPDSAVKEKLEQEVDDIQQWLERSKEDAMQRGNLARNRANEAGRGWKDGYGI